MRSQISFLLKAVDQILSFSFSSYSFSLNSFPKTPLSFTKIMSVHAGPSPTHDTPNNSNRNVPCLFYGLSHQSILCIEQMQKALSEIQVFFQRELSYLMLVPAISLQPHNDGLDFHLEACHFCDFKI